MQIFDGSLERNVTLSVTATDGSARGITSVPSFRFIIIVHICAHVAPNDYISRDAQIVFVPGQSATNNFLACGTIDIIDDNVVEEDVEFLNFSISEDDPPRPITIITASSATIVITEDDNDGSYN